MGLLDNLLGGGRDADDFRDFGDRFDRGAPYDGISDDEAAQRYGQVAGEIDDDTYHHSARETYERFSPEERSEFARQMNDGARERGYDLGYDGDDPDSLARMTTRARQQDPDLLSQLLGGMGGGMGGGGMGGMGGGMGGGNPLAKAALAGIATMAVRRAMGGR